MEFGKSLREAREAKGYTIAQIAESTHVMASVIEGLEKEDFSRIAAPIYGRGFVKLYCEAVGLDAKPFVDEFMAIVNGEHEIKIKERPVTATEPPPPAALPHLPPPSAQEPAAVERDLFAQDEPVAAEPPPAASPISNPEQSPAAEPKAGFSRYASPFRSEDRMAPALPVLPWRLILLGVAGLAILLVLAFGVRALYRATSAKPVTETEVKTETVTAPPMATTPANHPAAKPAARAKKQDIPSLYID